MSASSAARFITVFITGAADSWRFEASAIEIHQ
jgi:hypothetical protein